MDVEYNNITSNQAPGLNEAEKSMFLTKAEYEIVMNHFSANSKGNNLQQGFDDSLKRQADFSMLMKVASCTSGSLGGSNDVVTYQYTVTDGEGHSTTETVSFSVTKLDRRSKLFAFPSDAFIIINEALNSDDNAIFQVVPLRYDEYTRLMQKPFKRPLKNQAWRLNNSGSTSGGNFIKCVEVVTTPEYDDSTMTYIVRYIRKPKPIILASLDGLTIEGFSTVTECELDPMLHEEILQRAVELAKIAWTATGQDNAQMELAAGQRSE